jgi:hypothetical protein
MTDRIPFETGSVEVAEQLVGGGGSSVRADLLEDGWPKKRKPTSDKPASRDLGSCFGRPDCHVNTPCAIRNAIKRVRRHALASPPAGRVTY